MKFNDKTYSTTLGDPEGKDQLRESGTTYSVGSIGVPVSGIKSNKNHSPAINVKGSMWHFKSDGSGATPVVFPFIPVPQTYTNFVYSPFKR